MTWPCCRNHHTPPCDLSCTIDISCTHSQRDAIVGQYPWSCMALPTEVIVRAHLRLHYRSCTNSPQRVFWTDIHMDHGCSVLPSEIMINVSWTHSEAHHCELFSVVRHSRLKHIMCTGSSSQFGCLGSPRRGSCKGSWSEHVMTWRMGYVELWSIKEAMAW